MSKKPLSVETLVSGEDRTLHTYVERKRKLNKPKLKVLDLFSGIGGFSRGLEATGGFETVAFCEIDQGCRDVLAEHWPNLSIVKDVKDVESDLLGWLIPDALHADVICGGFPCQDISVAGKQKGLEGERSGLWTEFKRVIQEIKPRYAIIENVANLRGNGLGIVLKDLWKIGYSSEWHIIPACGIGAVHRRERIWILAYPSKEHDKAPYPDDIRLWSPFTSTEEKQKWWTKATSRFRDVFRQISEIEPTVCKLDDGISEELSGDVGRKTIIKEIRRTERKLEAIRREKIKQMGNSVVPQIPELIGQAILDYEKNLKN